MIETTLYLLGYQFIGLILYTADMKLTNSFRGVADHTAILSSFLVFWLWPVLYAIRGLMLGIDVTESFIKE